jgi:hypothetical protein
MYRGVSVLPRKPDSFDSGFLTDDAFLASVALAVNQPRIAPHPVWEDMLVWEEGQLARIDPAVLNLEVAKGIPNLKDLEVEPYSRLLDQTASGFARWLPEAEREFHADPGGWGNDLIAFRLGMLCQYVEQTLSVRYHEDQRDVKKISYSNPGDLFLHGVLDTRQGTCGNMAVLYLSLCWRLEWPVHLALAGWHEICRYDDGERTINIETTAIGEGGFGTPPDEHYIRKYSLLPEWITSGSDLTALKPRQMLGCFFGSRGRYWYDRQDALGAMDDYRRATELFPQSHLWREKYTHAAGLASEEWSSGSSQGY